MRSREELVDGFEQNQADAECEALMAHMLYPWERNEELIRC
jgi:hypothetical protein